MRRENFLLHWGGRKRKKILLNWTRERIRLIGARDEKRLFLPERQRVEFSKETQENGPINFWETQR